MFYLKRLRNLLFDILTFIIIVISNKMKKKEEIIYLNKRFFIRKVLNLKSFIIRILR